MSNELIPYQDIEKMGVAIAKSKLFGMKTPEEAIALMLVAQAEGLHPATAARDYHVIMVGGVAKPSLKADAILSRFQQAGGCVEWESMTDERVSGKFTHSHSCPKGVVIDWDMKRAAQAGFAGKDNWKKFPRQMLRARVISEGVRACYPASCAGVYTPEEVQDFEKEEIKSVPVKVVEPIKKDEPLFTEEETKGAFEPKETIEGSLTPEEAADIFGGEVEKPTEEKKPETNDFDKRLISDPQRKRLYAICKGKGMDDAEMKALIKKHGYEHSKDIFRKDYQDICEEAESWTKS